MKLTNKFPKITRWIFAFVLLAILSCSKDNEPEGSQAVQRENFVGLSLAKEIATEIKFNNNDNNSSTSKSASSTVVKKKIETIEEVKNDEEKTVFYVINYLEGGYILLAADNRVQPIIGYSEDNKFVVDKDKDSQYPLGLKSWIKNAEAQITAIQNSKNKQTEKEKLVWKQVKNMFANQGMSARAPYEGCTDAGSSDVKGPYLSSTWEQKNGFNGALPYITCNGVNQYAYAGCAPIAMAQIMKYYNYPANYDWSSMPLSYATATTANLILDIHNAIRNVYNGQPAYDCNGTGVNDNKDLGQVFKNKFNYTSADRADYNYQTVKSNLAVGKPVILSGFSSAGGHMWVCDGYNAATFTSSDCTGVSVLYFHMNWGWEDAKSNGYYAYNNFIVSDTKSFTKGVKMIYNIKP